MKQKTIPQLFFQEPFSSLIHPSLLQQHRRSTSAPIGLRAIRSNSHTHVETTSFQRFQKMVDNSDTNNKLRESTNGDTVSTAADGMDVVKKEKESQKVESKQRNHNHCCPITFLLFILFSLLCCSVFHFFRSNEYLHLSLLKSLFLNDLDSYSNNASLSIFVHLPNSNPPQQKSQHKSQKLMVHWITNGIQQHVNIMPRVMNGMLTSRIVVSTHGSVNSNAGNVTRGICCVFDFINSNDIWLLPSESMDVVLVKLEWEEYWKRERWFGFGDDYAVRNSGNGGVKGKESLSGMYRILKPGGKVYFVVHERDEQVSNYSVENWLNWNRLLQQTDTFLWMIYNELGFWYEKLCQSIEALETIVGLSDFSLCESNLDAGDFVRAKEMFRGDVEAFMNRKIWSGLEEENGLRRTGRIYVAGVAKKPNGEMVLVNSASAFFGKVVDWLGRLF